MHSTVSYKDMSREAADAAALADIREYCSPKQWEALLTLSLQVSKGTAPIEALAFGFGVAGISGYPFHAYCRHYCLGAFRTWMTEGVDGVPVDAQGFPLRAEPANGGHS